MDICYYEAFEEEAAELQHFHPGDVAAGYTALTIQEEGLGQPPAPVISIRTQSLIPESWLPSLKAVLSRSTGYDHLLWIRKSGYPGIRLGHLPTYCARAVAEQAVVLWMALLRRLPEQQRSFGRFHRDGLTGRETGGRKLAVIGVGQIGREVVLLGRALGMAVVGVDLVEKFADVEYAAPDAALADADVVVAAMNLTDANRGYFTAQRFSLCRPGAVFVNISRGELSPAPILLESLVAGHLGGVGLDVYNQESTLAVALRSGSSLEGISEEVRAVMDMKDRDDVILTPHNAFNTVEAVKRKSSQSVEQLLHLREHGQFLWPVPE
ncbi:MAG: NAD(P)-dependent oxidoreductase [Opitutaceae bacterium]